MKNLAHIEDTIRKFEFFSNQVKEIEKTLQELKETIKTELGSETEGEIRGNKVVTLSEVKTSRFDTKSFEKDEKELYNLYLLPSSYSRLAVKI